MNTRTILKIMPYVLGALIVILVGVIICTQLGNELSEMEDTENAQTVKAANSDKNNKLDSKKDTKTNESKNNVSTADEAVTGKSTTGGSSNSGNGTGVIGEKPKSTPTPVPEPTKAADSTTQPAATPTATPRITATPIPENNTEQLILDYVCTPKDDYVHTKNGVNLRLGPSTSTPVVDFLEWGMDVHRTGYDDEWTRLDYNGQECYLYTPLVAYVVGDEDTDTAENPETETGETVETTDTTDTTGTIDTIDTGDTTETPDTIDTPPAEEDVGDETEGFVAEENEEDIPDADDESTGEFAEEDQADEDAEDAASTDEQAPDEGEEGAYGDGDDEDSGFDWDEDAGEEAEDDQEEEENLRGDYLISLDPGHQATANYDTEPVGPDSSEMKTKVSAGATGVSTGKAEYELDLELALMLRDELEARGYNVVMTRTSNNVDISNVQRAKMANEAGADIAVRIHANSASDSSVSGVETICMTEDNSFNAGLHDESRYLADSILRGVVSETGANQRYVWETDTMTGINWSEVPVTIVEVGFMSNPKEDELLATEAYRKKIVKGIADGIDEYFGM